MGFSIWQLLIVLLIVIVLFGTKKLRNIGNDLGGAIKGFRDATRNDDEEKKDEVKKDEVKQDDEKKLAGDSKSESKKDNVIDAEVIKKEQDKI